MSNNIVKDVSDYLKELDNKMNVFRKKEDKLKKLEKKVNKARLDETKSIDELRNSITEYIELKKEVEASHKFFDEYKDLSDMYNEYYERIKGLKFKLSPYSNIDEYGDYVMRNFDVIFSNLKKEDIANSKQINYYLDDIAHYENKMKIIYEDLQKLEEKMFPSLEEKIENKKNNEENNHEIMQNEINTQEDFNLEELADMMTPEEMNTILQMKASGNYDDTILNNISTRLGVPVSKLEEIAAKKEAKLKEQEKDKEVEKDNNTNENSAGNSGSSSDTDTQEKSDDEKTPKVDTQLEKTKKVKGIGKITGKLKAKINANAAIAVAAVAAGIAILAANPLAMGYAVIAGAGKIYMDYSKGKK